MWSLVSRSSFGQLLARVMPFYGVKRGRAPGVYATWNECNIQVRGFARARYKKFPTAAAAKDFVENPGLSDDETRLPSPTPATAVIRKRKLPESNLLDAQNALKKTKIIETEDQKSVASVYTDGCCWSNGQNQAKAGLGVFWGDDHPMNLSEKLTGRQTNNRAEIEACCRGKESNRETEMLVSRLNIKTFKKSFFFSAIEQAKQTGIKRLKIHTDSQFTINAMTKWLKGWKKNGWKNGAVKNMEDFKRLDLLCQGITVEWIHVNGHVGIHGNEMADRLAKAGADK